MIHHDIIDLRANQNETGGGLATNITGRFESNRHAIARITKWTFGEAAKELRLKRNGGFDISANQLLEIYRTLFGEPEWHHAGKLPKQYGGGMKKTYFLNEIPSKEEFENWLERFELKKTEKEDQAKIEKERQAKKDAFLKKHGTFFSRVLLSDVPRFSITLEEEMNGKYGWFEASWRYSLPIYYSGYSFKSKRSLEKYQSM